jgi:hypothetical protein
MESNLMHRRRKPYDGSILRIQADGPREPPPPRGGPPARYQVCVLCREAIPATESPVVIPDFIGNDADPLWPYTDAAFHQACFVRWEGRKPLLARLNALARSLAGPEGYWHMTGEGRLEARPGPDREDQTPPATGGHPH